MSDEQIAKLLIEWERLRRGSDSPAEARERLCADHPDQASELRRRIAAIEAMESRLFDAGGEAALDVTELQVSSPARGATHQPAVSAPLPTIPGYEIVSLIDQGGMGVVYEARQLELNRTVAVKMMIAARSNAAAAARFRTEAEAIARLQHQGVVQIHDVGEAEGGPFYAMEYVGGGTLADRLEREPLPPREAANLAHALACAVHAIHERGIVHRDLKPSNVLLTTDGVPKITDFGVAKRLDSDDEHTRTGDLLGTPAYMAPEQAESRLGPISPRTDVYALGAILYRSLTGQAPVEGSSPIEAIRKIVVEEPRPPREIVAGVPTDLEAICLKCLEKSPTRRYKTAQALALDLERFLDGRPVSARPLSAAARTMRWLKRHPQRALLIFAALAVVAGLAAIPSYRWYLRHRQAVAVRDRAEAVAPQVREILKRNCFECHGENREEIEQDLDVLDHRLLMASPRRYVVPGAPDESRLLQRIADGSMPPEKEEIRLPRVSEAELRIFRDWVAGGAPMFSRDDPPQPAPPAVPYSPLAEEAKRIFVAHCYRCHKYDVAEGGIKILHHRLLVSVRRVVKPGDAAGSELFHLLTTSNPKRVMPPSRIETRLTRQEIDTIRRWIDEGAAPFPGGEVGN